MYLSNIEIYDYLTGKNDQELFAFADRIRGDVFGEDVYLRGIIEFSNYCSQNCLYCGLRRGNREIHRYRLTMREILDCAEEIVQSGITTIVLQTGEDPYYTDRDIADIVIAIKSRYAIAVTLSLGERSYDAYKLWRDAGADRYLIRMETFERENYAKVRPGNFWEKRLICVETLRELDYEVGSGIMIDMPGESVESLMMAIRVLTDMKLHMIGMGPFVAHSQTPFADEASGDIHLAFRTLALVRILNPMANIPSTSALDSVQPGARLRGLQIGANVIMPSFTPARVKELYNIYPGKNVQTDASEDSLQSAINMIDKAGYNVSYSRGDSPLRNKNLLDEK
ncbi:MAG: [FeFe] hydrogenase H-cluster radical SAM maturase HydE [Candidatus Marinimicrobia bacterium]|nr:[FeFe] hydrogenase H-cluster radical SAM maturase HydE [Candidatus Neomarinimicrobiota bacterium]